MSSLRVRVHARDTSTSGPILLSFSAGPPPPELLHASAPHGLTFDYMRSASSAQSSRRTLVAESDVVRLEARNYGAAAVSADAPFRYAVCVVSRKRARVDVYEADGGGALFSLVPGAVKASSTAAAADVQSGAELGALDSMRARREVLVDAFGSRKKQAMERTRKSNIVNPDAVAAGVDVAAMLAVSARADAASRPGAGAVADGDDDGDATAAADATADATHLLPPVNRFAGAPEDAYPIDRLIRIAALDALAPLVDNLLALAKACKKSMTAGAAVGAASPAPDSAAANDDASALTSAVIAASRGSLHVQHALMAAVAPRESEKKAARRKRVLTLAYLAVLLSLHGADKSVRPTEDSSGTMSASAALDGLPSTLAADVLGFFYEARGKKSGQPVAAPSDLSRDVVFVRSREATDRIRGYAVCLALVAADDCSTPLALLAADFRIAQRELAKYCRALGANVTPQEGDRTQLIARIKIPLVFPVAKRERR